MAKEGDDVVAFDLNSRLPPTISRAPEEIIDRIHPVSGSLDELARILSVAKEFDVEGIIQPAALLPPASEETPTEALKTNVAALANTCETARLLDLKRIIYMSSQGVYGVTETLDPVKEDVVLDPTAGMYHITKYMGELMGSQYSKQYGIDFMAIRTSMVFGPSQNFVYPLNHIVASAMKGVTLDWPDGGDHPLDYTYVEDLAWGILHAYRAPSHRHQIYNMSGGKLVTNNDIRALVLRHFPEAKLNIGPGLITNPPLYKKIITGPLDLTRAKTDLQFTHKFGFEDGLSKYIGYLKQANEELAGMLWSA